MRSRILAGAAIAAVALAASAVTAQPALAPPVTSHAAVTSKTEVLVRRLMKSMKFENSIDSMLASMMPVMIEQQAKQYPNLGPDSQKMLADTLRQIMRESFTPKLIERAVPIYAETFTEPELEQLVAFYESPAGQSIITKMPTMGPKIAAVTRELIPELTAELVRTICAKTDCLQPAPASIPKAKPS